MLARGMALFSLDPVQSTAEPLQFLLTSAGLMGPQHLSHDQCSSGSLLALVPPFHLTL